MLIDEDLATSLDQARGIGLGNPGSRDELLRERVEDLRVVLGGDIDIAAALQVGGQALLLEVMDGSTTKAAPPVAAPDTIRIASPWELMKAFVAGPGPT